MAKSKASGNGHEVRTFMGRPVRKETISLGIAGVIERNGDDPLTPPEATVEFTAEARVSSIKERFLDDGGVQESTILTIQPSSFRIVSVTEKAEDPKLPLDEDEGPDDDPKAAHIKALTE